MRVAGLLVLVLVVGCGFDPGLATGGDLDDPDAGVVEPDASDATTAFDPASNCPSSYDVTIAGSSSRYRVIVTEVAFAGQHAACNADLVPATHLVSFETTQELTAVQTHVAGLSSPAPSARYYIGAMQPLNQASETAGWLVFSGAQLPANQWSSGQPNDDGGGEDNQENLATLTDNDGLNDATGDVAYGAVCECDGTPIAEEIAVRL